jgi:hypothetical protein
MLKPRISKQGGQSTPLLHSREEPQERAQAVRPSLPRDHNTGVNVVYSSGVMPKGGFQSVWGFSGDVTNTKQSPTTKPGKKIY